MNMQRLLNATAVYSLKQFCYVATLRLVDSVHRTKFHNCLMYHTSSFKVVSFVTLYHGYLKHFCTDYLETFESYTHTET